MMGSWKNLNKSISLSIYNVSLIILASSGSEATKYFYIFNYSYNIKFYTSELGNLIEV